MCSLLFVFLNVVMKWNDLIKNRNDKLWLVLRTKVFEEKIAGAFVYFRENGIEPILIKGWSVAIEYPEKHQRYFGDIDLCVPPALFEKASRLLLTDHGKTFKVDLHSGLRHLDTLEWDDLFGNTISKELEGVQIRILRAEDHLRVLCVHWLTDGGANKNRLLDIYYLIINHQGSFDWYRALEVVSRVRREWIVKTIGLLEKYYGLDISDFSFADEARELPGWFLKTMEAEWRDEVKLEPIHTTLSNAKAFFKQLKKRFPPNPIQATIDMEGSLDDSSRIYYQIGSVILRTIPSIRRIFETMLSFLRAKNNL